MISCAAAPAYTPNQHNIPLFRNEGETRVAAAYTRSGLNIQWAHAHSQDRAIMVNAAYAGGYLADRNINRKFLEAGVGHFWTNKEVVSETYYGIGMGSANVRGENAWDFSFATDSPSKHEKGKFVRGFFQCDLGERAIHSEMAVSLRPSIVYFLNFKKTEDGVPIESDRTRWAFLIEPAATGRVGFENFKLQVQIGGIFSIPLKKKFTNDNIYLSLGLFWDATSSK